MILLKIIGIVVAFFAAWIIIAYGYGFWRHRRNMSQYESYDRDLNQQERDYLETALNALQDLLHQTQDVPKWYSWFLCLGYLPVMFIAMGVCVGLVSVARAALQKLIPPPDDALIVIAGSAGGLITIFAGLIFAGWFMYYLTLRSEKLSNYIALKSDIAGFDENNIHARQLALIEHRIRARQISVSKSFDAVAFLRGRNISYKDGCLKWSVGILVIGMILTLLDGRHYRALYPDHIMSSGSYWSLTEHEKIPLTDIDTIDIRCFSDDGKNDGEYLLRRDGKLLVRFNIDEDTLAPLYDIDRIFRQKGKNFQRHARRKDGKITRIFYHRSCVNALIEKHSDKEAVRQILHVGEL